MFGASEYRAAVCVRLYFSLSNWFPTTGNPPLTPWLLLSAGRCDDISFAVNQREPPGILKCDLQLFSCFSEEMIRFLGSWLWYKLSLNLVGAWYLIREQVDCQKKTLISNVCKFV